MTNTPVLSSPASVDAAPIAVKKTRAASLPAKYAKFVQFGYYLLKHINNKNTADGISLLDEPAFLDHIHMFDAVDVQQAFVQQFFDDSKNINLTMRKAVQLNKKNVLKQIKLDAKPPKVKKVRATTNANKPKKNKNVAADGIVAELVSLATSKELIAENVTIQIIHEPNNITNAITNNDISNTISNDTTTTNAITEPVVETKVKAKRNSKPKTATAPTTETPTPAPTTAPTPVPTPAPIDTPIEVTLVKDNAKPKPKAKKEKAQEEKPKEEKAQVEKAKEEKPKEEKEKAKRNSKAKTVVPAVTTPTTTPTNTTNTTTTTNTTPTATGDDDDDELSVEPLTVNGVQYLVDDNHIIYHFDSHDPIGTFNPNTQSVNLY